MKAWLTWIHHIKEVTLPIALIVVNSPRFLDVVWPESKQIGLIDSIFRNFYIPPIVFAVQQDEDGEEVRVCVDGKQVCTSIVSMACR